MSAWNRTPYQALLTWRLSAPLAQFVALGLWMGVLGVMLWAVRGRVLTFAPAFALAFVLLYWGRPVGWTLVYLEFVVVPLAWPQVGRWARLALLLAAAALMLSHWVALVRTAQGAGMPLLTLQSAALPWETWLVLPVSWLLLVWAARASSARTGWRAAWPRGAYQRRHLDAPTSGVLATDGRLGATYVHVPDACERAQTAQGRNDSGAAPGS